MHAERGSGKGGRILAVHKRMLQRRKGISLTLEWKLEQGARQEPGTSLPKWFNIRGIGKAKGCWLVRGELVRQDGDKEEWNFPFWRGSSSDVNQKVLSKLLSGVTFLGCLSQAMQLCALPSDKWVWDLGWRVGGGWWSPCLSQDILTPVLSCLPGTFLFWMQTVLPALL